MKHVFEELRALPVFLRLILGAVVLFALAVGGWFFLFQEDKEGGKVRSRDDFARERASSERTLPKRASQEPEKQDETAQGEKGLVAPRLSGESVSDSGRDLAELDGAPSFDVVRVDDAGGLVMAGRGQGRVRIFDGEEILGEVDVDSGGQWAFVLEGGLAPGTRSFVLKGLSATGREVSSSQVAIVEVPSRGERAGEVLAVLVPRQSDGTPAQVMQIPAQDQDETGQGQKDDSSALAVETIDYDDEGQAVFAGRGRSGDRVIAYLDNEVIGTDQAGEDGQWVIRPSDKVAEGVYQLRVDRVGPQNEVLERVELPFSRSSPVAVDSHERVVKVQPGNSLWRISRRIYGQGGRYTVIYQRNQDQIRDPNLIYPGQIFVLPQEDATQ